MNQRLLTRTLQTAAIRSKASTLPVTRSLAVSSFSQQRDLRWSSNHALANKQLVINAVGVDRLGIVSDMTKHVIDAGGNVGESQAAKLGKHFSLMMLVSIPQDKVDALTTTLQDMKDMNASVFETKVPVSTTDHPIVTPSIAYRGRFELEGADNPGIVHKVTSLLGQHGLSIDALQTSDSLAPYGGAVLFRMTGIATAAEPLAHTFDIVKIQKELAALGDSLNCDITLEDAPIDDGDGDNDRFVG